MNSKFLTFLFTIAFTLTLTALPSVSSAYTKVTCRTIPAHSVNGYWYPKQRVCVKKVSSRYSYRCYWVSAHRYHGHWVPARKVCRY
jgi:hypothetical protein